MPRIEILSENAFAGKTSKTYDICDSCRDEFDIEEGDKIYEILEDIPELKEDDTVGSTDVDHPSYENGEYDCLICGNCLDEDDD